MSQTIERSSVQTRSNELGRLTERLVEVIERHDGPMRTRDALVALARQERLPLSRMNYVLTFAKAEGKVTTDSSTSTIQAR